MVIDRFAIIIGAMKCGTTSLFQYLAQHPQIAPSTPKETHYFSRDENWKRGLDFYRSHWEWDSRSHRIALEASPSYTAIPTRPDAAERIAQVKADFRFIYVLRDPLERIESHLSHTLLKGKSHTPGAHEVATEWITFSKYAMQLDAYRTHFPADRILLLDFADLTANPAQLVGEVCRFLDIDDSFEFRGLDTAHNVSRKDHPAYRALTRMRPARLAAKLVPLRFKQGLRNYMSRRLTVRAELSKRQREIIGRELADDTERLQREYGFDTSRWLRSQDANSAS